MKITLHSVFVTSVILFLSCPPAFAQESDSATFKSVCAVCHTIGGGKLIGPDLLNVQDSHSEDWIINFVQSSQSVIKSGDQYADSIYKAYNQLLMPDHPNLNNAQVKGLIAYIKTQSSMPSTTIAATTQPQGNSDRGKELFVGNIRFMNNGAACSAARAKPRPLERACAGCVMGVTDATPAGQIPRDHKEEHHGPRIIRTRRQCRQA